MIPAAEFTKLAERVVSATENQDLVDIFAFDSDKIVAELYAGRDPHLLFARDRRAYNEFGDPVRIALEVVNLVQAIYKIVREYSDRKKHDASVDEIAVKWEDEMISLGIPADTAAKLKVRLRDDVRNLLSKRT
jgi:hypothetical protein